MEFEDFSQDFNDLWTADYGDTIKGASDIFDLSYLLEGSQPTAPEVVLNDRLMSESSLGLVSQVNKTSVTTKLSSVIPTPIKSDHSYSLNRDRSHRTKVENFLDIDDECFPAVSIAEAEGTQTLKDVVDRHLSINNVDDLSSDIRDMDQLSSSDTMSCCDDTEFTDDFTLDDETLTENCPGNVSNGTVPADSNALLTVNNGLLEHGFRNGISNVHMNMDSSSSLTCSTNCSLPGFSVGNGLSRICVSNSSFSLKQNSQTAKNMFPSSVPSSERSFLQSCDQDGGYPPTPPSSSGSDNESICTSPPRIPLYETLSPQYCSPIKKFSLKSSRTPISTPLISSQPRGATGALKLTEEEKRTLILEGYPVPSRLPLTKVEEKSLKKIRRKIKNKISAQESRRKKKEYMDNLEGKVDTLETENIEYKKRLVVLQKKNSSLLSELRSLQSMVTSDEGRRLLVTKADIDISLNL